VCLATGIPGPIFPGGLSHLCRKNFLSAPEKTAMLTCKITLPDSPYRVTISNNPRFRPLYLARQNEFRFFRILNTKKYFSSFLAAVFCPKNLAFARKIIARVWGRRLQPPSPLACTSMCLAVFSTILHIVSFGGVTCCVNVLDELQYERLPVSL